MRHPELVESLQLHDADIVFGEIDPPAGFERNGLFNLLQGRFRTGFLPIEDGAFTVARPMVGGVKDGARRQIDGKCDKPRYDEEEQTDATKDLDPFGDLQN